MPLVRRAVAYAEEEFGIDRLLISDQLEAAPGEMFLREYGRLTSLTYSGQFAIEAVLRKFLHRLTRDVRGLPMRLYPFISPNAYDDRRVIVIDPRLSYGRPSIASRAISTAILAERVNAGEKIQELAESYGLDSADVEEAIVFEGIAA